MLVTERCHLNPVFFVTISHHMVMNGQKDIFAEQQEERDRALMSRVTRESALERRLATQLIGIRQEWFYLNTLYIQFKPCNFEVLQ